jgi:hypothetical protein
MNSLLVLCTFLLNCVLVLTKDEDLFAARGHWHVVTEGGKLSPCSPTNATGANVCEGGAMCREDYEGTFTLDN